MVDHRSDRRRVQPAQEEMAEKAQLTGRVTALRSCDQPPGLSHPLSAEGTSDADRRDRPPTGPLGPCAGVHVPLTFASVPPEDR